MREANEIRTVEPLYSTATLCDLMGIDRSTLRGWVREGLLPAYRLGERTVRFRQQDVERFIASRRIRPEGAVAARGS
ncbi:MAG: helix-turn-helix domain-containing protein [Planctomycetes bacterium]|nr:helix-turn-helix domain-containing protein [Planctomycetota bacterium]